MASSCPALQARLCLTLLIAAGHLGWLLSATPVAGAAPDAGQPPARDLRWPAKQLNVLLDDKSLNSTQRLIVEALLDQLQHRTCLTVNKFTRAQLNPFHLAPAHNTSFVFIFNSPSSFSTGQAQFIGLSSLGCLQQGRQSMILTPVAYEFPRLVLRYHLLHTLGVANLSRPDEQVRQLLGHLPLNQRIRKQQLHRSLIYGPYYAYATLFHAPPSTLEQVVGSLSETDQHTGEYLAEEDLIRLRELYECENFQSRLPATTPVASLASSPEQRATLAPGDTVATPDAPANVATTTPRPTRRRAKDREPGPTDAVPAHGGAGNFSFLGEAADADARTVTTTGPGSYGTTPASQRPQQERHSSGLKERPMLLKLDQFHAQDPQLMRADQMKLTSILNGTSLEHHSLDAHQLLNIADLASNSQESTTGPAKAEMLISFEQSHRPPAPGQALDPVSALIGATQVLKLCSCACQTMSPSPSPSPPPASPLPTTSSTTTTTTAYTAPATSLPAATTTTYPPITWAPSSSPPTPPPVTLPPVTVTEPETLPATLAPKPTTTPLDIETEPPQTKTEPPVSPPITTPVTTDTPATPSKQPPVNAGSCELVEWVKPSKSIYSSAKIVWDMDRANQNYFICQTMINGELVPGKTHGFSCKVSSNGVAYEMHNFKVLVKPESVSLAWVQRKKGSLGRSNQPVSGGYSKSQDSYMVSRCLVRDENNDVITLIGYVNSHGVGWYPFDDIQIECAQYDVLACVSSQ